MAADPAHVPGGTPNPSTPIEAGRVEQARVDSGQIDLGQQAEGRVEQARVDAGQIGQGQSADGRVGRARVDAGQIGQGQQAEGPVGRARVELGVGIGWRAEIDLTVERLPGVEFVEVIAESLRPGRIPESLRVLRERGVPVIPHGVALGIGGADKPEISRLEHLAACVEALDAPLVSEHLAFVRGDGMEAGHLLPVPRTRDALAVVVENIKIAQAVLPVPFALENVAALFGWPDDELTEAQFLGELVERTGVKLLIDVANLYTNEVNLGSDAREALDRLPLTELAYVHVAGGHSHAGVWHDTHTASVPEPILDVLTELCARVDPPGVLLEWDDDYPSDAVLAAELTRIRTAMNRASTRP